MAVSDVTAARPVEAGRPAGPAGTVQPVHWKPLAGIAAVLVTVLAGFIGRYGLDPDEMYFWLLGRHGLAWGYVDQPPLLPLLVRGSTAIFGDTAVGVRIPAIVCAVVTLVLAVLVAAELGGRLWAQMLTAAGLATSLLILGIGHFMLTTSVDNVTWGLVILFAVRALLRDQPRWWIPAGLVFGLALYGKLMIVLLLVTVVAGLLVLGPRSVLRQREFLYGALIAIVVGSPNLIYQATHNWPQVQMAQALGAADGASNRAMFAGNLIFLLGPVMMVFCVAGLIGLFRDRPWRPIRAFGIAYLLATVAAVMIDGGRPDYTAGYLVLLLAAGSVRGERWAARRRWRTGLVIALTALFGLPVAYLALPAMPVGDLAKFPVNSMALETVGWPGFAGQVEDAVRALPPEDRAHTVILAQNFGQYGALDLYGGKNLPPIYSGHNELHAWGPPPEGTQVVVSLGIDDKLLRADFRSCTQVGTVSNPWKIENPEYGRVISVCRAPVDSWAHMWPAFRHLNAYE